MTDLHELTQKLIDDPKAADKLKLIDSYIEQRKKLGRQFILPSEHAELKALIERYSKDLPRFVNYVKSIRDEVPPRGTAYISLHEFYRTLRIRQVQQERRERIGRAVDWFEKKYPKAALEQRDKWVNKLEQAWGRERLQAMDIARRKTKRPRLTTVEREQVLEEFWNEIDERVAKGDLPPL